MDTDAMLKYIGKHKEPRKVKTVLRKKSKPFKGLDIEISRVIIKLQELKWCEIGSGTDKQSSKTEESTETDQQINIT